MGVANYLTSGCGKEIQNLKLTIFVSDTLVYGDGLHLSESLVNYTSVRFCTATNGKERREPCMVNLRIQVRNSTVKKQHVFL